MYKEMFIHWNKNNKKGGVFKISMNGTEFTYEIVSGSAIEFDELIGFLWFWPGLEDVREYAKSLERKNSWTVESREGMSGCTDWWIRYLDKFGMVRRTETAIIHESMCKKANEKVMCWVKDLYDLLWHFKENNLYTLAFADDDGECGFTDITENVISRRETFKSSSYEPTQGFVSE